MRTTYYFTHSFEDTLYYWMNFCLVPQNFAGYIFLFSKSHS